MLEHLIDTEIPDALQPLPGFLKTQSTAGLYLKGISQHMSPRAQSLHERRDRRQQDAPRGGRQFGQGFQPLRYDFRQGRKDIVGQGFPIREMQNGQGVAEEETDLVLETNRGVSIFRDHQIKGRIEPGGLSQSQRIGTAHQPAPDHAAAIRHRYRGRQQGIHVRVGLHFFHNPLKENRPAMPFGRESETID